MDQLELDEILRKHKLWLEEKEGGERANLQGVDLHSSSTGETMSQSASQKRLNLQGANLKKADLQGVNLQNTNLKKVNFLQANLKGADLSCANLNRTNFLQANLQEANLECVYIIDKESYQDAQPKERFEMLSHFGNVNFQLSDLQGANLQHADFNLFGFINENQDISNVIGADFQGANLQKVDLRYANLTGADLTRTDLRYAKLTGIDLTEADLTEADLTEAILIKAKLGTNDKEGKSNENGVDINNAILREADFQEAECYDIKGFNIKQLGGTNIRGVKGLDIQEELDTNLERIGESAKKAQNFFHIMLLACLYSLIGVSA